MNLHGGVRVKLMILVGVLLVLLFGGEVVGREGIGLGTKGYERR